MVRNLVWLKTRLTWNGIRHDTQRRIGFPLATILLGWAGWWLATALVDTVSAVDDAARANFLAWAALLFFAAWVTLPVVIFPLDENLDPQQLAVLPISHRQIVAGLAISSLIAPASLVLVFVLGANVSINAGGWWMAIPASLVYIGLLAVGAQLFSAAISAILRTRRGRDVASLLVLGIAAASFFSYRSISQAINANGLSEAVLSNPIIDWAALIPPVAAQRAITDAASGSVGTALLYLAVASVWLVLMGATWRRLMSWMLTTPQQGSRPAARARRSGFTSGLWGPIPTLARKELRFYIRDPRQRLVWTGTVIFVGFAVAGTIMGTTGLFDLRDNDWAPLMAPVLVLFVGLPIALNLFGWERNAASYLFVLPASARQLLVGKNMAVALALLIETIILALGLSFFTGFWRWTALVLPYTVAAIGCQLAVGNIVSVLTPLRLPREGTDVFAQSTEQGCLAIVSQVVSFFSIGLLMVIPASIAALTVSFGSAVPVWFATISAIVWGVVVYSISLWVASKLLRRRLPEVMAWVQVV